MRQRPLFSGVALVNDFYASQLPQPKLFPKGALRFMATEKAQIHRAKHDTENPYYMAARSTAQDKSISYDALGLLNYILSKPDDWIIQPHDLEREKCKRGKVYAILKELIDSHYVERIYHRDDKQRVTLVEYIAHEKPLSEKPEVGFQEMENQDMDNQHITEYREEQNTEDTPLPPKRGKRVKSTVPIKSWSQDREKTTAYYNEHREGLDRLFDAWGYNARFTDLTTVRQYQLEAAYHGLCEVNFNPDNYQSLSAVTHARLSWKDNLSPLDMLEMVDSFHEGRLSEPPPEKPKSAMRENLLKMGITSINGKPL